MAISLASLTNFRGMLVVEWLHRAGCDFVVVSSPFPNVWTLIFPHCPKPLSLLSEARGSTPPGGGGASVCFLSAVFPPSFCFTWEEIGEKIINTMCSESLLIQTCDSTLNAKIATAIIVLIEYRNYTDVKHHSVSSSASLALSS